MSWWEVRKLPLSEWISKSNKEQVKSAGAVEYADYISAEG